MTGHEDRPRRLFEPGPAYYGGGVRPWMVELLVSLEGWDPGDERTWRKAYATSRMPLTEQDWQDIEFATEAEVAAALAAIKQRFETHVALRAWRGARRDADRDWWALEAAAERGVDIVGLFDDDVDEGDG